MNSKQKWEESAQQQSQQQEDSSNQKDKESSNYERHIVENTPFTIAKTPEGFFVTIGRHVISEKLDSKEEALEDTERTDWERLIQIIQVVFHAEEEIKNLKNLENKEKALN